MFELWDGVSGNLLQVYSTQAEAFAAVRAFLNAYGRPAAEELAVIRIDRRGRSRRVAQGAALIELARQSEPLPPAVRAS